MHSPLLRLHLPNFHNEFLPLHRVDRIGDLHRDRRSIGRFDSVTADEHLHDRLKIGHFEENRFPVSGKFYRFHVELIVPVFLGVGNFHFRRAVVVGPAVVPLLDRPGAGVFGGFLFQWLGEGDFDAGVFHVQGGWRVDLAAGVANALECGAAFGVGLPALESADVKLAIAGVEPGAHAAGLEVPGEANGAALDLAVYFFVEDVEEARLAVGEIEKFAFGLAPFVAGDEDGIAAGIVPAWVDEPAEGVVSDDGKGGDVGEFRYAAEHAGLDPVEAIDRDPGALIVAGDGLSVFADAHAVGGAKDGG